MTEVPTVAEPDAVAPLVDPWTAPRPPRSERMRKLWHPTEWFSAIDWLFLAMLVLLLGKAYLTRFLALGDTVALSTLLFETAGMLAFFGLVDLLWPRRSYTIDLIAYTVLSILMLGNVLYVGFYEQIVDPRMLAFAGQVGTVKESLGDLLAPIQMLFVIDIPILIAVAVVLRIRQRGDEGPSAVAPATVPASEPVPAPVAIAGMQAAVPRRPGRSWVQAVIVGIALVVFAMQVNYLVNLPGTVDGIAASRARGLGAWQVATLMRDSGGGGTGTAQVEAAIADEVAAVDTTLTPAQAYSKRIESLRQADVGSRVASFPVGVAAGKNVIIIQVESLQSMVVGARVDGQEITPNFNKLVKQSWYFPNTYSETGGGNTADAEFVVNTGLYPPPNGQAAAIAYVDRELPGIPRMLGAKGYRSITFHANNARYWNRTQLYPALGFNKFYDMSFFSNRDSMWLGPSDEVLFEDGFNVIKELGKKKQPFYAQFITLSSHPGYSAIPQNRRPLKVPEKYYGSFTGNYTSSESYTDFALGKFIANLKSSGLWDDSVVVIYGDHTAFLNLKNARDKNYVATFLGRRTNFSDRQRVPLLIHLPGQKKGERVESSASHVDIMPTVADLVGVDLSEQPHMGRSVFVGSKEIAVFRSYFPGGSFVSSGTIFMPGLSFADGVAVNVSDGSPAPPGTVTQADYDITQQLNTLSDSWIRSLPLRADAGNSKKAYIPGVTPSEQLDELKRGNKK